MLYYLKDDEDSELYGVLFIKNPADDMQEVIDNIVMQYDEEGIEWYVSDIVNALRDMGYELEFMYDKYIANLFI